MGKFLLRRVIYLVLLTIVASAVAYMLAATQLNPRSKYEGRNPPPAAEVVDRQLDSLNMNDKTPLLERFGTWASGVIRGDFGKTIDGGSVNDEMGRRMWVSLRLMLIGSILGTLLGVAAGAYGAIKQHRWSDRTLTVMAFVLLSVPTVVLAVLVKNAGIWFNQATGNAATPILFTTGEITPGLETWSGVGLKDRAAHLVLPTIVLAMNALAFYSRYQRNSMLDVLGSDYLRTAQAKGLRRWKALTRHGLRTALIPMATFFSYQFALIFVGATFTEKIFGWHGMGEYFVDSITKNDVNAVAGVTFFVAVLVLIAGLLSDIVYAALDPRVRV
ncbi:MAG TPA: ABC transporter permease [Micromonospora sp.]|nr:ABC transporter permease [Micromonospora sp.]